ncbi:NUDIX domain-containing protein [Hyphomicrobiales bacterium BP6-180914]|uniref:NUDIX domain-containing protein n=2 Tax=Lichenifustis flavocetrariae TaxID=2949735 RepID=A0AA42CMQ4_9HYPH|nr:NUDIX domain-containing protein [Lichenifustis flavocetrariae]MCW6508600.1 NUDIX domain-containing protein [Lichenifustis flavocetrariae]
MRPLTLGVRAAIFDEAGRVFLVKHSYVRGWHLPGGGVEPGETAGDALRREVREETGLEITGEPALHGVFFNRRVSRRDHVLVYAVRKFSMKETAAGGLEIVDRGFFPPSALPADATRATRARLDELVHGTPLDPDW